MTAGHMEVESFRQESVDDLAGLTTDGSVKKLDLSAIGASL